MKTVDMVKTAKGYYVTRRYCGQNKGAEFFKKKKDAEAYAKEWMKG